MITTILTGYLCGCIAFVTTEFWLTDPIEFSWRAVLVSFIWPINAVLALLAWPFTQTRSFRIWRFGIGTVRDHSVGVLVIFAGWKWCAGIAVTRMSERAHQLGPFWVGRVR